MLNQRYEVEHFKDNKGFDPVQDWFDHLNQKTELPLILSTITRLEKNGLALLGTNVLKKLKGRDHNYELRKDKLRVALYENGNTFILLYGFFKKGNQTSKKDLQIIDSRTEYLEKELKK